MRGEPAYAGVTADPRLPPIEELLLQRHDMLLLDSVVDFGVDHIAARAKLAERHPLAEEKRGLPAWIGIELMAQAVSAFSALELRRRNMPPRIGLLLGTRKYEAFAAYFPANTELIVRAKPALRDSAGLGVFDCAIHQENMLLARARVKGYMPDNIEEFLKTGAYG